MATIYGSATFGLTDESANGLYGADISLSASLQEAFVPNHIGDDIAVGLHNESSTLTASGVVVTADDIPLANLGKEPTVANSAIYANVTTVTEHWVQSIDLRRVNNDFETGSWTANGRPGITSIAASA